MKILKLVGLVRGGHACVRFEANRVEIACEYGMDAACDRAGGLLGLALGLELGLGCSWLFVQADGFDANARVRFCSDVSTHAGIHR